MTKDIATVKAALEACREYVEADFEWNWLAEDDPDIQKDRAEMSRKQTDAIKALTRIETALSSPPAIDLGAFICGVGGKEDPKNIHETITVCPAYGSDATYFYRLVKPVCADEIKKEARLYFSGGIIGQGYKTVETFIDHLATTGRLAGDDLGELLKRVPEAVEVSLEKLGETWFCGLCKETRFLVLDATGSTPAEAVRKAMEKMEEGE